MSTDYGQYANSKRTPQNRPIPGREKEMKENNAGGYVFKIGDWERLSRFLIIGSVGGTYYVTQNALSMDNIGSIKACIKEDGVQVVKELVKVSDQGLALRNDPALFVLALCASADDSTVRTNALDNLPKVARTATHLFIFISYITKMRGWGRGLKTAVANWYQNRRGPNLAYQIVKYRNREGYTHRDVLRLTKPVPKDDQHDFLYGYATDKVTFSQNRWLKNNEILQLPAGLSIVEGAEFIKKPDISTKEALKLITDYKLTHEMIPNELKNQISIWDALLPHMPMTATLRNLAKMTSVGLLKPMSNAAKIVNARFADVEAISKSRMHPIAVLQALKVYNKGKGIKGKLTWTPVSTIEDALDRMFYLAFKNVKPTNKNILLALDVSGSMAWSDVMGINFMTCSELTAAMALVTANVEPNYQIFGFADKFRTLGIKASDSLVQATKRISGLTFGGTDCALPMMYAKSHKLEVDAFFVYTDNETWAGLRKHPTQALKEYRIFSGINTKLCVIATAATEFTIADPKDPGMMDISGFSADTPKVLSEFTLGNL